MDCLFSDFDSFSESSISEDLEDMDSLYGGQARTIFSNLEETIEKIDDFLMFERGYVHGDIVRLVSDPLNQMGKVINLAMTVDVETIKGFKIPNVSSKNLHKIRSVSVGDYVVHEAYRGKVEKIVDRLTILLDNGSTCQFSVEGPEKIIPVSPDITEDLQYYPGQRVQVESSPTSNSTSWLCGIRKDKREQGTICNVDAGLVYINWLCHAFKGETRSPSCLQDSKDLTVLSSFPHANWQLGDWCVLPLGLSQRKQSGMSNSQEIAVIVKTKTKVDVQWQDGSQSLALDSNLLFPVNIVDAHDFWPDTLVSEKGTVDDSQVRRSGFVTSVNPKEKIVNVKWFKYDEEQIEETVSAYELVEHPEYTFTPGEAVYKAAADGADMTEYHNSKFLSYFATIFGFNNGDVEVQWANGATSKIAPHEIYRVDKCEGTTVTSALGDDDVQPPNEEHVQKFKDVSGFNYDTTKSSSPSSNSQVAIGVFTSIASSVFGSLTTSLMSPFGCTPEGGQIFGKALEDEAVEPCRLNHDNQFPMVDDLEMPEKIALGRIKEANEDRMLPSESKCLESFRQFDMVNDCSDHHFFNGSATNLQSPQMKRGWLKKVHQEWNILEKDLPETIYVRVYEEQINLLRAAVVGTEGTPYHDGLFFFDICLPPQYPDEPPMLHYNSGGLRINPNLYESGKVCLSLVNTWTGSKTEVWNPGLSTILQVLLSLQALVLNERPYFNEAGFDSQIGREEGEKNSISYNENAFLVNCRSMLYILRNPPKHFEALVDQHFHGRSKNILLACEAYMQGAPIGHPFICGNGEQENLKGGSTGFKIMLSKLYPKLVEAFSDKGIDCNNFLNQFPLKT